MTFRIQVKVNGRFTDLRRGGAGPPYEFEEREQAELAMRLCYPDQLREQRLGGPETVKVVEAQPCPV